jgi:ABC-type phosphate/phosphonate transport system substrate-binding protein
MPKPLIVGAVLYDPKVSVIWDIIRAYFEESGVPMDVVFFTNYELQVDALIRGHVDMAWNSPLAWIDAQRRASGACRAISMRDTDRDRCTHIIARKNSGIGSVADLKGKTIGFGAKDSPQATLIPVQILQEAGLTADEDYAVRRFDVLVGKHGDHIGGELDAFKALEAGQVDASCLLDLNWEGWTRDGTINASEYGIVATTPKFDHCVFTVLESFPKAREEAFLEALFAMDYDNPQHREMMDLEGLKKWEPGRTSGFGPLKAACELTRFFKAPR